MEFEKVKTCIFFNEAIADKSSGHHLSYTTIVNAEKYTFYFCIKCFEKIQEGIKGKEHIVRGLILLKLIPYEEQILHWVQEGGEAGLSLKVAIEQGIYPRSPKEKFDNLFKFIFDRYQFTEFDQKNWTHPHFLSRHFLASVEEMQAFVDAMDKQNLIDLLPRTNSSSYRVTYDGVNYYMKTFEEGFNSKNVFIAMAFREETKEIRDAIKLAVIQTGYTPIIVDEQNFDSDRTINDEIISRIRSCKFCIADFSFNRLGVYFESGFALGMRKPLIYSCSSEHFKDLHFDVRAFPVIKYDNTEQLGKSIVDKIRAWID